jgi:hypothetical protein
LGAAFRKWTTILQNGIFSNGDIGTTIYLFLINYFRSFTYSLGYVRTSRRTTIYITDPDYSQRYWEIANVAIGDHWVW